MRDRLVDLTITDEAGEQSDTAEIRLDDRDGKIELSRKGAEMEISLGWGGGKLTKTGRYTVDETELRGPPDTLVVRAKGADMDSELKAHKTRSWDDVSIGDLVSGIAADHGLEPRVGSSLRGVRIPHLDQTDESDLHLLTRLARDYDAIAKPASGRLLFLLQGQAESASGQAMPVVQIRRHKVRNWRMTLADRGGVRRGAGSLEGGRVSRAHAGDSRIHGPRLHPSPPLCQRHGGGRGGAGKARRTGARDRCVCRVAQPRKPRARCGGGTGAAGVPPRRRWPVGLHPRDACSDRPRRLHNAGPGYAETLLECAFNAPSSARYSRLTPLEQSPSCSIAAIPDHLGRPTQRPRERG